MPIKEIKNYAYLRSLGDSTLVERMELLIHHRQFLNEKMEELQTHMEKLDDKIEFYRNEIKRVEKEKIS